MRATVLTVALFAITSLTGCNTTRFHDCGDGVSVGRGLVCDGVEDCWNGSDEAGCAGEARFDCGNGMLIDVFRVCDGLDDCFNGADEERCFLHWTCASGEIISPLVLCDTIPDCSDGSDEEFEDVGGPCVADRLEVIACTPTTTLAVDAVCDGVRDGCSANADEQYCTDGVTYHCDDGIYAVFVDEICDGIEQCPDRSDERYCN